MVKLMSNAVASFMGIPLHFAVAVVILQLPTSVPSTTLAASARRAFRSVLFLPDDGSQTNHCRLLPAGAWEDKKPRKNGGLRAGLVNQLR
jgi:hypothetical protein